MDLSNLVAPVLSLGGLGLVFGCLLGFANKKFSVEVDPKIPQVRECLPGANCGGCGFAGCDAYAEAIVNGEAKPNRCNAGGAVAAEKIAKVLGVEVETSDPICAHVKCNGTCSACKEKFEYYGALDCRQAALTPGGGSKACQFGCLGLGSCVSVCQFGAIKIVDGVAKIDDNKCVACGACKETCPKGLIDFVPVKSKVRIDCSNKEKGKDVMTVCEAGCIGCGLCAKNCPKEAITMEGNLPVFDYSKCVGCGICANKCPKHAIENLRKVNKPVVDGAAKPNTGDSVQG